MSRLRLPTSCTCALLAAAATAAITQGAHARAADRVSPTFHYCEQLHVGGSPRWSFHGGHPITGVDQSFAVGHGAIDRRAQTASGVLCRDFQPKDLPGRFIVMRAIGHYVSHSASAPAQNGYTGNVLKLTVRVVYSADARCGGGSVGHVTLFGTGNGARSDSVALSFTADCKEQDSVYRGANAGDTVPSF